MRIAGHRSSEGQLRRLVEELGEAGLDLDGTQPWHDHAVHELDYALRPDVHERRVPSFGAFIEPSVDAASWETSTLLRAERRPLGGHSAAGARHYADGMSSWLLRRADGRDEWVVFDRPAGSERDLVVLGDALGTVIVQRHPSGLVRVVGSFGVFRWDGRAWQHQPLVSTWVDMVTACPAYGDPFVLARMLEFAVHDLGARSIGATLVYRPDGRLAASFEERLAAPPPLRIVTPADLAPLRHILTQIDGAALFDHDGVLTQIGVRLVPSAQAESDVDGFRGTRHTSARRYTFDDPAATVVVISEDGPVSVLRAGEILGASATPDAA